MTGATENREGAFPAGGATVGITMVVLGCLALSGVAVSAEYTQQTVPFPDPNFSHYANFGWSLDVSGEWAIIGSRARIGTQILGAALVYHHDSATNIWSQTQLLPAPAGFRFDTWPRVTVSGGIAVVGGESSTGDPSASIYRLSGSSWSLETNLVLDNYVLGATDSPAVAVSGNHVFVSAPYLNPANGATVAAVHVYGYNGTSWEWQGPILAPESGAFDGPGCRIAADGNVVVVGAPSYAWPGNAGKGAAYVYEFDGSTWQFQQAIPESDASGIGGAVAVSGDRIAVAASRTISGSHRSVIEVYDRVDGTWVDSGTVIPTGTTPAFYLTCDVSGDTMVLGSDQEGRTYVFQYDGLNWIQTMILSLPNPETWFGTSVSIDGNTVLVSNPFLDQTVPGEPPNREVGAVYFHTIPEPATLSLLAMICLPVLHMRRHRRPAVPVRMS